MFGRSFSSILDECLTAMSRGASIDNCLARYPRHADRLRQHLHLAEQLTRTPQVQPAHWAESNAWNAVQKRAEELRSGRRRRRGTSGGGFNHSLWMRPLAVSLVLVMALFAAGGATALAAQDALPDSPLYRVKLAGEDVRLWFVFDDTHKAEILLDQSKQRAEEITTMVQKDKPVPSNVLSALENRNERANEILSTQRTTEAFARMLQQFESQERLLIEVTDQVATAARDEHAAAVASIHNARIEGAGGAAFVSAQELTGGFTEVSGVASPLGNGVWDVGGKEVVIDGGTIGSSVLQAGANVRFVLARTPGSTRLRALSLIQTGAVAQPSGTVVGEIDEITNEGIRIAGQFIRLTPDTLLTLDAKKGERVEITLAGSPSEATADVVRPAATPSAAQEATTLTFEGTIAGATTSDTWTVGSLTVDTSNATFDLRAGPVGPSARVLVDARVRDGDLIASNITVLASSAPAYEVYAFGTFQGLENGMWMVSGLALIPPEDGKDPAEGSFVAVMGRLGGGEIGALDYVVVTEPGDSDTARMEGAIAETEGTRWITDVGRVHVTASKISGRPIDGVRAIIWGRKGANDAVEATYVRILDDEPLATANAAPSTPKP